MNTEQTPQEPVGGMMAIVKEICSDFMFENSNRNSGYKAVRKLFDDWFSNNHYWQKKLSTQPPAPIKTEGEDEKELAELRCWKESAMKVMADIQEIGKELGVKLGESIHDKILPAIRAFKAGYSASLPQSSNLKEGDFITGDFPYKESKSSTEEEKELVEKLKYVDHVLSDDGYQSESEIRSIVKDVMNYFKRNL